SNGILLRRPLRLGSATALLGGKSASRRTTAADTAVGVSGRRTTSGRVRSNGEGRARSTTVRDAVWTTGLLRSAAILTSSATLSDPRYSSRRNRTLPVSGQ